MPLISVVMPVYNTEKYVAEAIESILAQTFVDFEFIIVDDASKDRSADIIRSYAQRDKRIRFIQLDRQSYAAGARNAGFRVASGKYIAAMDADDVSLPQRFQMQVDYLESNPQIGLLATNAKIVDAQLKPFFRAHYPLRHAQIALHLFVGPFCLNQPTTLIRREILAAVGGYKDGLIISEDLELYARLISRTTFACLPEELQLCRKHVGSTSKTLNSQTEAVARQVRMGMLQRIWTGASEATFDRFALVRRGNKLNREQRKLARRDITHLIDMLIAADWVEPHDKAFLLDVMNEHLEHSMPRRWQQFLHWQRHRLGRAFIK